MYTDSRGSSRRSATRSDKKAGGRTKGPKQAASRRKRPSSAARRPDETRGGRDAARAKPAGKHVPPERAARTRPRSPNRQPASLARRRLRKLRWDRLLFVLVLAVASGVAADWLARSGLVVLWNRLRADVIQVTRQASPLPYTSDAYGRLSNQLAAFLARQSGMYAVAGEDLVTGATFGVDPQARFTAAQTVSLPLALDLYEQIAAGRISPSATVSLTAADETGGSSVIGGMPAGTRFTVAQLARAATVQGDSVADRMLIRRLGSRRVNAFLQQLGADQSLAAPGLVTPFSLAREMAAVYRFQERDPALARPLLADLRDVPGEGRLAAGLPPGTPVWQVTGDWPKEFHDAVLTYMDGRPIALAVCSYGATAAAAARVEAQVARLVDGFDRTGL